ncbi:MAG: hypothetical protein M1838_002559 [Thelocarpon superellum]|nr:MAG: hypothetical protein M1838_002559 [Thelocarpon superellum]
MAASVEAPRQFQQPSRKGKRAWRKNVDLTDVQEGLDTVRKEVIEGGVIAEKASDELYTFDSTGDTATRKACRTAHKPLRADEILAQRSAVPAIDSRTRAGSKTTDGVLERSTKRRRSGKISHAELQRLRTIAYGGNDDHRKVHEPGVPEDDLWEDFGAVETMGKDPMFTFLEPPQPIKAPRTLKHTPISLAANGKAVPAVKAPAAHVSYNPQSDLYFEAFTKAGEEEIEAELKRQQEAAADKARADKIAQERVAVERYEALHEDEESLWEGLESEVESEELTRRRPERKTQAQRNKIARRKEAEHRAAHEAQMKRRAKEAGEVQSIAQAVEARERKIAAGAISSEDGDEGKQGDDTVLRRRRLGKATIPEPPLELVLPSELQESLRKLKPEGNLLKDRFRNLMVRGKVEARRQIAQPKKRRVIVSEKWSYKDWKLKPGRASVA